MVTNYRDLEKVRPDAPSRGELVTNFLLETGDRERHLEELAARSQLYNGFSLIAGDVDRLWYMSNYAPDVVRLDTGLYGLSNHLLETPWPKVEKGKRRLEVLLKSPDISVHDLYDVLSDKTIEADDKLPNTGVGKEWERLLSAAFIESTSYGTRASTVILVDQKNGVSFNERTYDHKKADFSFRSYEYHIG